MKTPILETERLVLGLEGGPPIFSPDSTCPLILWILLGLICFSSTRLSLPLVGFSIPFDQTSFTISRSEPLSITTLVQPLPLSLATTHGISFDFSSSGYLDVSVPRVPRINLWIQLMLHTSSVWGFPHSDTCGSMLTYNSPQLFAVNRVLLRLLMPRHSPCALVRLNFFMLFSYELSEFHLQTLGY